MDFDNIINELSMNRLLMNKFVMRFFQKIEKLIDYRFEKAFFLQRQGYELNLKNPRSFNEKVFWKKIFDRNPLIPIVSDKYRVRNYLKKMLGEKEAEKILIPLLHVTDRPETIPFDELPEEYIIKATHGSGMNIMVEKNSALSRNDIIKQCHRLLKVPYGIFGNEWAYESIKRKLVVEELLRDENGEIPRDYKLHMMHGECVFLYVDFGRFSEHTRSIYDKNWNYIEAGLKYPKGPKTDKPGKLDEMLAIARKLSNPFDFIRVDLYLIRGNIYFGELTSYPGGGLAVVTPTAKDFEFGEKWIIEPRYWEKK